MEVSDETGAVLFALKFAVVLVTGPRKLGSVERSGQGPGSASGHLYCQRSALAMRVSPTDEIAMTVH
jgi:hypothetical protein